MNSSTGTTTAEATGRATEAGTDLPDAADEIDHNGSHEANGAGDGGRKRGWGSIRWNSPWTFPIILVLLVFILGMFKVSFSSVGLYSVLNGESPADAGVLFGDSRGVRSDEWFVRTPWIVRQSDNGFATSYVAGVGEHQTGLISELPTASWHTLMSPQTLYYFVFDVERAFALEWMTWLAVQAAGVYALAYALTRRVGLSAVAGVLMVASPVSQWWTVCATYTIIGWACMAGAALIWSIRSESTRRRYGLAVGAGLLMACSTASMYLPWLIGVYAFLVPLVVGALINETRGLGGPAERAKRIVPVLAVAGAISLVIFGANLLSHGEAVTATANTVYPGQREAVEGGGFNPSVTLGAQLDYFASGSGSPTMNGLNQSENSAGLALYIPATLALLALSQRRRGRFDWQANLPLIGAGLGTTLLAAWMWLPIPAIVGTPIGFNRLPVSRVLLPLTLAGILLFVMVIADMRDKRRWLGLPTAIGVSAIFAFVLAWAAGGYTLDGARVDMRIAAVLVALVAVGVGLSMLERPARLGLSVLVVLSVFLASRINPVQIGLGPLLRNELRETMQSIGEDDPDGVWAVFTEDHRIRGVMQSTSVPNLAGVSVYPNKDAWLLLDEEDDDQQAWNRFGITALWEADSIGQEIAFGVPVPDTIWIYVSPCDDRLRDLNVRYVVVPTSSTVACGTDIADVSVIDSTFDVYDLGPLGD